MDTNVYDTLQFRASKINMALARMDKLVKKLMSNPEHHNANWSIIRQLLLSVKWHHMFSYEVKTGPIYRMETNIKSGNGWF